MAAMETHITVECCAAKNDEDLAQVPEIARHASTNEGVKADSTWLMHEFAILWFVCEVMAGLQNVQLNDFTFLKRQNNGSR